MSDSDKADDSEVNDLQKIIEDDSAPVSTIEKENNEEAARLEARSGDQQLFMDAKVYSPFKVYYEGTAFSVSAVNQTGPFDILPRHHNFISLLTPCDLIIRASKGEQKFQISGGIMHVKADKLIVFLDV